MPKFSGFSTGPFLVVPCHYPVCAGNQALGATADPRCGKPRGMPGWQARGCGRRGVGRRVLTPLSLCGGLLRSY